MTFYVQKINQEFMRGCNFSNRKNQILRVKISLVEGTTVTVTLMNTGQINHTFLNLQTKINLSFCNRVKSSYSEHDFN